MKALVFGRTGQVARALAHRTTEAVFLDRAAADLSDPGACAAQVAATDADVVINAAAWTAVDKAEDAEALAQVVNAAAPGAMAQVCAARRLPFVHLSTEYVFDGRGTAPWRPGDGVAPLSAYGRTKLAGEAAVRAAGGPHVILRTSWVFSDAGANFVTAMLRLAATRDRLRIVADQVGGPTWASDIAGACLAIAGTLLSETRAGGPADSSGTHHYAGYPDISRADFARAIFAAAGRHVTVEDIPTSEYPTPAPRPLNSRLDCTALQARFGLPRPDWRAALARVLADVTTPLETA